MNDLQPVVTYETLHLISEQTFFPSVYSMFVKIDNI